MPTIKRFSIDVSYGERGLTLEEMLEHVRASYEYACENRQHHTNVINAPAFHPVDGEVGLWEMEVEQ